MNEVMTPDGIDSLVTVAEAARLCRVSQSTVRMWVNREKLPIAGKDRQGRNVFKLVDVARCEHATRQVVRKRTR